jgi:ABC-type Na+ efflux pump permease subunit
MQFALGATLLYAVLWLGSIYSAVQGGRTGGHTMEMFATFVGHARWGSLGVAAILAGPSLLADVESDALELYLSRPLSYPTYLAGKIVAVVSGTALTIWIPALIYVALSFVLFENQPGGWNWLPLTSLGYALLWSIPIAGIGLGLSCVARSSRAASLWLFGGVVALDVLVADLLSSITAAEVLQVLSPMAALTRQNAWLFDVTASAPFPPLWGLISLAVLAGIGWGLLVVRHPMVRGREAS